ncbi:MAG: O-acetyl-ADP-ribose deacetylase (regulator of RNase III) [Limisphaerales bacterium]|jgi:O-acetyl-ADP-ribose deacetylase (regulator of RNase III)
MRRDLKTQILLSDITKLNVEVIVNAANSSLLGGGGVDGAIHRAAGAELVHECRLLGGCNTGDAKITKGYDLAAKHIVHTVGPVWRGGTNGEGELLQSCYERSMALAIEVGAHSIAFPSISTGIFRYPIEEAAKIAIETVAKVLRSNPYPTVIFCCFSEDDLSVYERTLVSHYESDARE